MSPYVWIWSTAATLSPEKTAEYTKTYFTTPLHLIDLGNDKYMTLEQGNLQDCSPWANALISERNHVTNLVLEKVSDIKRI